MPPQIIAVNLVNSTILHYCEIHQIKKAKGKVHEKEPTSSFLESLFAEGILTVASLQGQTG